MTESQKQQIISFRRQGIGYLKIAQELGISQNTVKSYCRRNNLTKPIKTTEIPKQTEETKHFCLQCGVAVPEQAKTERLIYKLFLDGMTMHTIAVELTKRSIKTPSGKDKWNQSTVRSILTNEKYKGDALLQKSYTVDFLTKKTKN